MLLYFPRWNLELTWALSSFMGKGRWKAQKQRRQLRGSGARESRGLSPTLCSSPCFLHRLTVAQLCRVEFKGSHREGGTDAGSEACLAEASLGRAAPGTVRFLLCGSVPCCSTSPSPCSGPSPQISTWIDHFISIQASKICFLKQTNKCSAVLIVCSRSTVASFKTSSNNYLTWSRV